MQVYGGYGEAVKTVCRELRRRMPEGFTPVDDWRSADLTVDLTVDSPIGTLTNVPRDRDPAQHDWHRAMLARLTGPQRKVLFVVCCFENSEVLRYACREAAAVFSFLPDFPERLGETRMNWHLQPLGVDPHRFTCGPPWDERAYDIYTWGYVAETEYIDAIHRACNIAGKVQLHSGRNFGWAPPHYHYEPPLPPRDCGVAERYRACRYANAMRAPYGFELAALEATLCGARPICLDLPCYRHWFGDLPSYVTPGEGAVERIAEILQEDRPTRLKERQWVWNTYNWDRVAGLFWRRVEESL